MSWYPSRISTRLTIGGILLLAVTTAIIIVVMLWRGQPRVVEINTALIEETGRGLTSRVSIILSQTDGKTVSLARLAEVLPNDEALYRYIPPNLIESNSLITGGGIWPEPGTFTPGVEKRSFFWARNTAGELVFSDEYNAEGAENYHNESWYRNAREQSTESCLWSDVYRDAISGVNMVTCSVPYKTDGKFAGVATTDIRLDNIAAIMQQYGDSTGGYAFVTDRQGQLIYFPGDDSKKFKTFDELAAQSAWLAPVAAGLKETHSDQSAINSIRLDNDGQLNTSSQVMLFPMADTGWVIGLVTPEERITGLAKVMMQDVLEVLLPIMALLLLGSWLVVRRLITRLDETRKALDDIAQGEGDLTRRMDVRGADEISAISQAFNLFADKISSMLLTVRNSSSVVAGNTVNLADNNNELSARVTQQAAALEQSASAMEELNATVRQNSENTHQADELAETTAQTASRCGDMMRDVISTMNSVSTSSGRMVEIVSVIDSIAFQTNILALNAAVEAARAGDSGRGFAVVATEVRSLAQRSAQAAQEIKTLIDESVQNVKTGSNQVHEAGETLADLVMDVLQVRQLMGDIRVAGEEQSKGLAEVTTAVSEMDTTVQQNASLIDDAASRTQILRREAEQLAQMVSAFKLPEPH
ncbi:methyl-accepting chemotaxis protein [Morganella morganii]|uniref:methyl-accepting chemotaxis protein n=1 Tax=Morganella morganii TaxID=582 RepID=UPI001BD4D735|nr:methyl-accepting chemotaxis protein [Morganella morganii]BEP23162.1 methyl-accepting chemotaxis protein [Morganella morganii subsp. sibonii]EKK5376769.1 HAMP domain-containing protein [Morganella morganii]ELB1546030.1 HAMP domain-containing protein [Morganella morganii]MBS9542775.1 HAMP domain-containing protein [Morganella morganii subsp. morganii]HDS6843348.1 HAMP domain-containing protein [Morganella morganii subsp. morganii]